MPESNQHSRAESRVFSHSLGSPALETIGMGLELCDQPECTNGAHLVGFLRHRVGSLEEQLEAAQQEASDMRKAAAGMSADLSRAHEVLGEALREILERPHGELDEHEMRSIAHAALERVSNPASEPDA